MFDSFLRCVFPFSAILRIIFIGFLCIQVSCTSENVPDETDEKLISRHIEFLASNEMKGRLAGSMQEAIAANYIADRFLLYGLLPTGDEDTYLQQFVLTGPLAEAMDSENVLSRNVTGTIPGSEYPDRVVIIGAHYDGQGFGGAISMDHDGEPVIHPSADDNASGTAGLLSLARFFSMSRPAATVQLVAFSGEEMGLLGSSHFVEQLDDSIDKVIAMINLDMIGRLTDDDLTIFGAGSSNVWNKIFEEIESDSLNITRVENGTGSSDHTPFYRAGIPVLHYFTGTHEEYHRPEDRADKINLKGMTLVLDHVKSVVQEISEYELDQIEFTGNQTPQTGIMSGDRVTTGVLPDYSFSGHGFRIGGVRDGQPAERAGLKAGDVIIKMNEIEISDIYSYMEALTEFESGQEIEIVVNRNGTELTLFLIF